MTFIDKAVQEHSIEFTRNTYLEDFSIQKNRLVFTCDCGEPADCIGMLYETLFPLNAMCDFRFHSFVYSIESRLVGMWADNFTNVIPVRFEDKVIPLKHLDFFICNNFDMPFHAPLLFQELNLILEVEEGNYPLILYNGLTRVSYGCKLPLAQYYEKGMLGLTYQCKKCLISTSFDIEGNRQHFEL